MKKLLLIAAIPMLAVVFMTTNTTSVSANTQQCEDITISNTGAGSENEVTCEGEYKITIECENETKLEINVDQDSESGNATISQNTTGGSAQTGDAVNLGEIDALIENNCFEEEVTTTETPTPPAVVTPPTPPAPAPQTLAATTPETLPTTGSTSATQIAAVLATISAAVVGVTKIGALAYEKSSK